MDIINIFLEADLMNCRFFPRFLLYSHYTMDIIIFLEADLMHCKFFPRFLPYPHYTLRSFDYWDVTENAILVIDTLERAGNFTWSLFKLIFLFFIILKIFWLMGSDWKCILFFVSVMYTTEIAGNRATEQQSLFKLI